MTISTAQIRGARGLLDWSQAELSRRTGISTTSIGNIESGNTQPRESTMLVIRKAFEEGGIEFLPGSGLRLKDSTIDILEGSDCLDRLLEDILSTVHKTGGEVCAFGVEEREDKSSEDYKKVKAYIEQLEASGVGERVIIRKGDTNLMTDSDYYRWIDEKYFSPYPFFIYGNKVALMKWEEPQLAFIINSSFFSLTLHKIFDYMWNNAESLRV